ncbi:MAG: hypothetical protein J7641_18300 [Cyanobacteria bacterium SID2]|nr:hypothetical protein [Cyanobacteria bacterium SID2]MBP0005425.1 hypothetical protein [Cyanobacteria bacterium SBC]
MSLSIEQLTDFYRQYNPNSLAAVRRLADPTVSDAEKALIRDRLEGREGAIGKTHHSDN